VKNKQVKTTLIGFLIFTTQLFLCSCGEEQVSTEKQEKIPIARVGNKYLYANDLQNIFSPGMSSKDSANIASRYVDTWVQKQLLLLKAEENTDMGVEIEKRVEEYRQQLLLFAYEKKMIEESLDTTVTAQQIEAYYRANESNFELKQNIVRCLYLKLPKDKPLIDKIKALLYNNTEAGRNNLISLAAQFAEEYHLSDTTWKSFDELISGTPWQTEITNPIQALKTQTYFETSDQSNVYLLKINDYKILNQTSPLQYVEKTIRDIIINKRKIELRQQNETNVFKEAVAGRDYEIFNDK
jgi:hypothetical protein